MIYMHALQNSQKQLTCGASGALSIVVAQ
uniref:Uncharacterized protein n=1 Tax=Arundo donax TaxID=35708 RepID=A0A0A9H914_ARUDO